MNVDCELNTHKWITTHALDLRIIRVVRLKHYVRHRFAFAVFKMAAVQSKKQRQRGKSGEESTFVQHFGKLFNCVCGKKLTYLQGL